MNRFDEFADAFQGWMAEWYASRNIPEQPAAKPSGHVSEDGGWVPDYRDEEGSDVKPELERYRS